MPAADRAPGRTPRQAPGRSPLAGAGALTHVLVALAIVAASFVKGAIAFGFPVVATPLLALLVDVKTSIALTILPNIVMDAIQTGRNADDLLSTVRRVAVILPFGFVGTVLGTWSLVVLAPNIATAILGMFVLAFVAMGVRGATLRVPARWEPWLSPPVGLTAGFLGGVTNVPGTLLVMYFHALGMEKRAFVRASAMCFLTYKLVQFATVAYYGLLTWPLLGASALLTLVGLGAFAVGLRVQDWMPQRLFNRAVLVLLGLLGLSLLARAVWG